MHLLADIFYLAVSSDYFKSSVELFFFSILSAVSLVSKSQVHRCAFHDFVLFFPLGLFGSFPG